jgi:hypothetical protein
LRICWSRDCFGECLREGDGVLESRKNYDEPQDLVIAVAPMVKLRSLAIPSGFGGTA